MCFITDPVKPTNHHLKINSSTIPTLKDMLNVTSFDSVTGENRPKQAILDGAVNKFLIRVN